MQTKRDGSYLHQTQIQQSCVHPKTVLEHSCALDIDKKPAYVRQTCAVCTAGDSWSTEEGIEKMIFNGMNIIRLNMTLNTREHYENVIKIVRKVDEKHGWNPCVAIAVDLTAPTVRTGMINGSLEGSVTLNKDTTVVLTPDPAFEEKTDASCIFVDTRFFPNFCKVIRPGDNLYLDDGAVHLKVHKVEGDRLTCTVSLPGELGSLKRLQIAHNRLYTDEYEKVYMGDLLWAKENQVDLVFTSLADTPDKVVQTKEILGDEIKVLPKIETRESVGLFSKLLAVSDGIIINRGALGTEYPHEKVFKLQKMLISQCMVAKKPVFVIHQLLESMCYKPRATRAEVCDVGNAVLDGADGLILAVETGRGEFPLETLHVMHKTSREAEGVIFHAQLQRELKNAQDALLFGFPGTFTNDLPVPEYSVAESTVCTAALAAVEAAFNIRASAILVPTISGRSAKEIAMYRPSCPVVAIVRRPEVARHLHLYRGLHPFVFSGDKAADWATDMDMRLNLAMEHIRDRGFVCTGDFMVIVNGWNPTCGTTNTVRIISVPEKGVAVPVLCQAVSKTVGSWPDD